MITPNPNRPKKKQDNDTNGGGLAPRIRTIVGPDRRAQAVLRRANMPKEKRTSVSGSSVRTTVNQPGVGLRVSKETSKFRGEKGTTSTLEFNRYKPGSPVPSYATKRDTKRGAGSPPVRSSVQTQHKDRLRRAALEHGAGRQMQDVRPGNHVEATALRSSGNTARNPRASQYERMTRGALDFDRGHRSSAESTKLTKNTWQTSTGNRVQFDPNTLKDRLKAMAQGSIVRATGRLIGGPITQAALTIDDAVKGVTGKRPSREVAKAHVKGQKDLLDAIQKRRIPSQAPWAGSGPF